MDVRAFLRSFRYAAQGVAYSFKVGRNFKVQSAAAILAIVLGAAFAIEPIEWLAIVICIGAVLGGECLNTGLESLVDLVSPEVNELAGHAKDCAAGAVLVCAVAALFVAAIIFLPRIIGLLAP